MSVLMVLRVALKALGRNKMRTSLTMLGMIIGIQPCCFWMAAAVI